MEVTWAKFLEVWHGETVPMLPVEPQDISIVGALMKERGYRSFANYVSNIKQMHIKAGYAWTPQHELEQRQGARSVTRGQGPPRQAAPFDDGAVAALEVGTQPVCAGGPINPVGTVVLGAAFLLREIEVAYARLGHLDFDACSMKATLLLPVSKTDVTAVGCSRSWGCTCGPAAVAPGCIYRQAVRHHSLACEALGVAPGDPLTVARPLFPDIRGETITKCAVVATIEALAGRCGEDTVDADGKRRFGGHSLRVSGTQ